MAPLLRPLIRGLMKAEFMKFLHRAREGEFLYSQYSEDALVVVILACHPKVALFIRKGRVELRNGSVTMEKM
jgi:hypothetical protein